jgi:hypothetical protein
LVLKGKEYDPSTLKLWRTRVYASGNSNVDQRGEYHYSSNDQTDHNHLEEKEFAIA